MLPSAGPSFETPRFTWAPEVRHEGVVLQCPTPPSLGANQRGGTVQFWQDSHVFRALSAQNCHKCNSQAADFEGDAVSAGVIWPARASTRGLRDWSARTFCRVPSPFSLCSGFRSALSGQAPRRALRSRTGFAGKRLGSDCQPLFRRYRMKLKHNSYFVKELWFAGSRPRAHARAVRSGRIRRRRARMSIRWEPRTDATNRTDAEASCRPGRVRSAFAWSAN